MFTRFAAALGLLLAMAAPLHAETGYDLWLRYRPIESQYKSQYAVATLVAGQASPTMDVALRELRRGLSGMLGTVPAPENSVSADGALVVGTPQSSSVIAALGLPLQQLGGEGYLIRGVTISGHKAIAIAANSDVGVRRGKEPGVGAGL